MKETLLDDFADVSGWLAVASGLAQLHISQEPGQRGTALRLDFDFAGGGGFVVARREVSLTLPESYALLFDLRGEAPANRLEIKLSDPSGQSVWWYHRDAFALPVAWQPMRINSREIEFAWGPAGGDPPSLIGAIEIALAAPPGGKGTVWLEDLRLEDRTPQALPVVTASSALGGHPPESVLDPSGETSWRSASNAPQWLLIDFQSEREYGGLILRWEEGLRARDFAVQTSNDGVTWTRAHTAKQADASQSYVYLPGGESRYLRIDLQASVAGRGFGLTAVEVKRFDFSRSINAFFENIARDGPRGAYPKYLYGEQTYWSPVGVADGETCALLNEEGMVEVDRGTFSIEPFVFVDGQLLTWADGAPTQELERGYLPIPSSVWQLNELALRTTAFATRSRGAAVLWIRYRVENHAQRARDIRLFAACRPFQVTPPWQAFQGLGGVSQVKQLEYAGGSVRVDRTRAIIPLTEPSGFGAATFAQGAITEYLRGGELPPQAGAKDDFGYASGALRFDLTLAASSSDDVYLAIPFGTIDAATVQAAAPPILATAGATEIERAIEEWTEALGRIEVRLPPAAQALADTSRTAAAHILIQRDGPALQPGPRRYTRAWIRDGAVMAAALLRMGHAREALEFIRWYAPHQGADGSVPCCVDRSGPDWLVEHDSHGELIFTVMECFRFTHDRAFLQEMWPRVARAAEHIEALRSTRLTAEYQAPEKRAFYGLLPESASHEGYLAHPVHAYWDDFWGIRGLGDAAASAEALGRDDDARRWTELRDTFRVDTHASIRTTIAERKIAYLPGSVEWADFDPTATSNAISLLGELPFLPRDVVDKTFAEYLAGFRRRVKNEIDWANYTPYEIRIIGALVRLGMRAEANELAGFFLGDRRPLPWNQWPEIAWRDPKSPGHLGDVPHTWIAAEYILAFHSMLAFEQGQEEDRTLVIAAGVPAEWLESGEEVVVRDLPTYYGRLSFTLRRISDSALSFSLSGEVARSRAKLVLRPPLPRPLQRVEVNGSSIATFDAESATTSECPAEIVLWVD